MKKLNMDDYEAQMVCGIYDDIPRFRKWDDEKD